MAVAEALTDQPVVFVGEQPVGQRPRRALDLAEVDVHARTRGAMVQERGRERSGDEARRERVGDRAIWSDRLAVGPPGEVVEARERGTLSAEARVVTVGT